MANAPVSLKTLLYPIPHTSKTSGPKQDGRKHIFCLIEEEGDLQCGKGEKNGLKEQMRKESFCYQKKRIRNKTIVSK